MIPGLSIVIPAYNEADYISRTLESIACQDFEGDLEVIVVDGHSEDDTIAVASAHKSRIGNLSIISAGRDIGRQRNAGAALSKNPYILFMDSDVILPPGVLNKLSRKTTWNKPFVATAVHTGEHMSLVDHVVLILIYALLGLAWLGRCPVTNGDFLLTTRETHERLAHGFAEDTLLGEDTDYGLRCFRAGARYHFYSTIKIIASDRRMREMGRRRLVLIWSRAFIHVIRKGPVPKDSALNYPYGQYGQSDNSYLGGESSI
jgi:glycosyltransferase involved in cell wall biosynthesis